MSNKTSPINLSYVKDKARLKTLVEQLKTKLKTFAMRDREGELVGEVKDLVLDNNCQLKLVISQVTTKDNLPTFLLDSNFIEKVDAATKSVIISINKVEIEQVPEYVMTEIATSPVTPAPEVVDGTKKNSVDFHPSVVQTPAESKNIQEEPDNDKALEPADTPEVLSEEIFRLLGERVVVDRSKRKVGEVIVRKEIKIRMVQVPVRYEKLIVEEVSPEHKILAEIDLLPAEVTRIAPPENPS